MIEPAADLLRCVHSWCDKSDQTEPFASASRQHTFARGVGLPGRVWETRRAHWIADVTVDSNFSRAPFAQRAGLHGAAGFPILSGSTVLGVLEFFSCDIRQPDPQILDLMAVLSGQVGQFMQRLLAQEALRRSEARYRAAVDTSLDCIVGMDRHGNITDFNPSAERTFGYRREEVIGRAMSDAIIPPELRDAHKAGLARYLATGEVRVTRKRIEIVAVRKDGERLMVELSITRNPGEPPSFTGFLRDITAVKLAQGEISQSMAAGRAARDAAERANQMKDEFLATVSHELRTPLNAIVGWSQLLHAKSSDPATVAEAVAAISRNARIQTRLIEDLLDMSRIITGKLRLSVQQMDLTHVIEAAIESVLPAASAKNVQIEKALDVPATPIAGDPARMQQVFWNLLSNSVKFTPMGGRVQVQLQRVNKHLEISVSDNGEGIRPDFLPRIFDRFSQGDGSTTRAHAGLGIGLALVKQLVELHGGSVRAASAGTARGSTFTVSLPASIANSHKAPAVSESQGERI